MPFSAGSQKKFFGQITAHYRQARPRGRGGIYYVCLCFCFGFCFLVPQPPPLVSRPQSKVKARGQPLGAKCTCYEIRHAMHKIDQKAKHGAQDCKLRQKGAKFAFARRQALTGITAAGGRGEPVPTLGTARRGVVGPPVEHVHGGRSVHGGGAAGGRNRERTDRRGGRFRPAGQSGGTSCVGGRGGARQGFFLTPLPPPPTRPAWVSRGGGVGSRTHQPHGGGSSELKRS